MVYVFYPGGHPISGGGLLVADRWYAVWSPVKHPVGAVGVVFAQRCLPLRYAGKGVSLVVVEPFGGAGHPFDTGEGVVSAGSR